LSLICVLLICLIESAPPKPTLSETFTSATDIQLYLSNGETIHGSGVWIVNQPAGKVLEKYDIEERQHKEFDIFRLTRNDLKKDFDIIDNTTCVVRTDDEPIRPVWAWIEDSSYDGQKTINGRPYDLWSLEMGYAKISVAIFPGTPNTPSFLIFNSTQRNSVMKFTTWNPAVPHESYFAIPSKCSNTNSQQKPTLGCVGRSTMISRAAVWVKERIPYSQTTTHDGYREDCSGYVSMAWETSKPGYTTFTMNKIAHPISKSALQPGDVLLCRSDHVVLFGGWTSSSHTSYTAYEETRPGEGTVKRVDPYPYFYNTACFLPYRFNSVC